MILESQPAWQAIPHEFVEKVGTRAKEWNEGRRGRVREGNKGLASDRMKGGGGGRVREGNTELIADRDVASLKLSFHQSLF